MFHYDGAAWQPMTTNSASSPASIWGNSASDVFAVGIKGTIMHYPDYASPSIRSVTPDHATQGETIDVTIIGYNLAGAASIDFGPNTTINSLTTNSSNRINANVSIEANSGTGPRHISVTTPGGTATFAGQFNVQDAPHSAPSIWIWVGIGVAALALGLALSLLLRRKPSVQ